MRLLIAVEKVSKEVHGLEKVKGCTFRRNTSTDLNVRLLNSHTSREVLAASAAVLSSQHPLSIGVRQTVNGYNADTSLVVAAIARPKPYAPSGLRA